MRIFVIIELIFAVCVFANCQKNNTSNAISKKITPEINITVHDINKDSILIEYNFKNIDTDSLRFIIPKVIPGTYRYNNAQDFIKKIYCYSSNETILDYKRVSSNVFLIPVSNKLQKIKYYVHKGDSTNVYDVLTKFTSTSSYSIINPFSFIGYLNDYKSSKHTLSINNIKKEKNEIKKLNENNPPNSRIFKYKDYYELAENPHLFCACDTAFIENGKFKATVLTYSDNKNITSSQIAKWIYPITKTLNNYTSIIDEDTLPYKFIFIFSDKVDRDAALEQKNASTYCFRSNWDTSFLAKTIQHISAHEYLHRISSLYFHSDTLKSQLYKDFSSRHLWFYEGVTEYLSLKANLDAQLISLNRFIEYLSMMYSSIDSNSQEDKKNLLNLSQNILELEDFQSFQDFYNKGGLIAFCLDLEISISTKGRGNLMTAISDYISQNGRIFNEEEFISDLLGTNMINNVDSSIFENGLVSHVNESLQKMGYYYSEKQKPWVESVSNQFFIQEYYKNDEGVFIHFNENAELKNRTIRLIKIEQKNVQLEEVIKKLIYPPNSNPVKITFETNNKVKTKTIKPITRVGYRMIRRIKHQESINEIQKKNLEYFTKK